MTLDDALMDVDIAFQQVEFSIKLLSYCELDRIHPAEFDTHQVVLLEGENLTFPTGRFSTQQEIVRASMVAVQLALAGSALTLDQVWDVAGIRPDPGSPEREVKLRTLVYMVRCAYAHGVADPRWEVRRGYRQVLELDLANTPMRVDFRALHGRSFDFAQLGGHARWFDIRDESLAAVTGKSPGGSA